MATRTASRDEIQAHVAPAVSPRTIGNRLLPAGLKHEFLWPSYYLHHDTAKHGYSGVVKESVGEWNGALLSSVLRVGSDFCLYASDGLTPVWRRPGEHHLPECIRPRHTDPTSGFMVWGANSYNSQSHLVILQDKVNSARYIVKVINLVLLPFLRQEGNVLFQADNARPHAGATTQRALHGVKQLPWPARSPDFSPIEHVWDMIKEETLSPEPATIIH